MLACAHCATPLAATTFVTVRCRRCGAVSHSDGTVISPATAPVNVGTKLSPWMLHYTRPIVVGIYECRFRQIEPATLFLRWDGERFYALRRVCRVRMGGFMGWRGSWV